MCACAAGWQHSEKSVTSPKLPGKPKEVVTILHRLHFTSALKRMATLVKVSTPSLMPQDHAGIKH